MPLTNSPLEQLQRDAKKKGAFQARLALAGYLLKQKNAEIAEIERLIDEVADSSMSNEFQQHLYFLQGQLLQIKNAEPELIAETYKKIKPQSEFYFPAIFALKNIYAAHGPLYNEIEFNYYNRVLNTHPESLKMKKIVLPNYSAEYEYKMLRKQMLEDQISPNEISERLNILLNHPELTDTLKAKICYRIIETTLRMYATNKDIAYLNTALETCKIFKEPRIQLMDKADKVSILSSQLMNLMKARDEKVYHLAIEPKYMIAEKFFLFRPLYRFLNFLAINSQRQKAHSKSDEILHEKISHYIESDKFTALTQRKKPQSEPIQDNFSSSSYKITAKNHEKLTYPRVNGGSVQIFLDTMSQKLVAINFNRLNSIHDLKEKIVESILPNCTVDDIRLIHQGRQICDDQQSLEQAKIENENRIHVLLRLKGD